MGNTQTRVLASLSVCTIYFVYAKLYCSFTVLKTKELHCDRLPSFAYLFIRYFTRYLRGTAGCLSSSTSRDEETAVKYTVRGCRLDALLLRRFCSVAGYGWDYPDSEYRDVPLCFPEALCFKLLLTLLTDRNFKLSPAGLVRVRQSIRTLEPIDELKKGPFQVQASVLVYRAVSGGVEVDIGLSATSQRQCLVWESVLTLMSPNKAHSGTSSAPLTETKEHTDGWLDLKQVELKRPRFSMMSLSSSDLSLWRVVSAVCGFKALIAPRLWMLSVCLAEIEKHKGVTSVSAPACVTAQFTESTTRIQGKVQVQFWDWTERGTQDSQRICFNLKTDGSCRSLVEGQIFKPVPE